MESKMNVLFIRGLTREKRHWRGLEQKLQIMRPDLLVHSIDLPGAGTFFQQTSPIKFDDYIYFLREKLSHQKKEGKTKLIGISMGGMIALRWAQLFPDEISQLFIINSSAGKLSNPFDRFNLGEIKEILGAVTSKTLNEKEKNVLKLTTAKCEITDELLNDFVQIKISAPVSIISSFNQIAAAFTFTLDKNFKLHSGIEVVVMSGLKDKLVNPKCSEAIALKLNAQLFVHEKAGHDLSLDDPEWFLEKINQHI
jgi:pimeloyl-[acyl-carrier protein] methyl ester esterase